MIRKRAPSGFKPLYRHLIRDAFKASWQNRAFWPLALFAGVLQTGGVLDIILFTIQKIQLDTRIWLIQKPVPVLGSFLEYASSVSNLSGFLSAVSSIQNLIIAILIIFAFLAVSIICQGALVYGLYRSHHQDRITLHQALSRGAKHFPALAILNIITHTLIWITKSLVLLPTALFLTEYTWVTTLAALIGTICFAIIFVLIITVHMLSVNAMTVHEMTLVQAINVSVNFFRKHLITVLELGILLFVAGFVMLLAGLSAFLIASIPFYILLNMFFLVNASGFLILTFSAAALAFFSIMLIIGAWNFTFNYAAWERLYDRFMNHEPISRLHRSLNWLLGK